MTKLKRGVKLATYNQHRVFDSVHNREDFINAALAMFEVERSSLIASTGIDRDPADCHHATMLVDCPNGKRAEVYVWKNTGGGFTAHCISMTNGKAWLKKNKNAKLYWDEIANNFVNNRKV